DGYGNVVVYCASATGAITGDADDPSTDLGIGQVAIERRAVPLGVNGRVITASAITIAVTFELWMYDTSGRSDGEIEHAISDRLKAFMAAQPIGGNKIDSGSGHVYK